MSWSNPTEQEAEDNYQYYKNRYNNYAAEKAASERREANYVSQRNQMTQRVNEYSSQKLNFEQRLEQIELIIRMLEGSTTVNDVPSIITNGIKSITRVAEIYPKAVIMSGVAPAAIGEIFKVKSVLEDLHSSAALEKYKSEKTRLETAIANLKQQIAAAEASIGSLNSAISACNAQQASCQSAMYSSAYEMNHYNRYRG
jgi:exonuclease VII small subunit